MSTKRVIAALAAGVFALSASTATAETRLKVGTVIPTSSPWGKWVQEVVDQIEEDSNGELILDVLFDGQAGDEQTILRQTVKGRLDIGIVSNVPLTLLSQEMALPSVAYLFDSTEQGSCVAHQHLAESLEAVLEEAGVIPVGWWEVGNYAVFSRDPVRVPEDLNGQKVRLAPSIADATYASMLDTSGVPMGTADTIPALQTGTVDAAFFPIVYGIAIGTHKVAPNILVTEHSRLIGAIALSSRSAESLSDQEIEWLGAFSEMAPALTDIILQAEQSLLEKASEAGAEVVRPTDDELAKWRDAAEGIVPSLVEQIGGNASAVADALAAAKLACD